MRKTFNESIDQDVIDERDAAPAVVRRKQPRSALKMREAHDAFADLQMLHDLGLNEGDVPKWD